MKSRCSCGAVYTIKPEFLGKRTLCKHCGQSFIIAAEPSAPPSASTHLSAAAEAPPELEPAPDIPEPAPEAPPPPTPPVPEAAPDAPPPPAAELEPSIASPESEPSVPPEVEEIEPVKVPAAALVPARLLEIKAGGRRPFLAMVLAAVAGTLVGAGLMGFIRQGEIEGLKTRLAEARRELNSQGRARQKLGALKKELDQVQDEVRLLEGAEYPAGSIPQTLARAAVLEYKTAEALLRQQVAALESGAELTVAARGTVPDPKLAAEVEGEMARLQARLEELRRKAEVLGAEPLLLLQTAIATEELNLAILNRNRLIARHGLSAPLPPRGPAGAGE